jgi:hypothetical protein
MPNSKWHKYTPVWWVHGQRVGLPFRGFVYGRMRLRSNFFQRMYIYYMSIDRCLYSVEFFTSAGARADLSGAQGARAPKPPTQKILLHGSRQDGTVEQPLFLVIHNIYNVY